MQLMFKGLFLDSVDCKKFPQPKDSLYWNNYMNNLAHDLGPINFEIYCLYSWILFSKANAYYTPNWGEAMTGLGINGFWEAIS